MLATAVDSAQGHDDSLQMPRLPMRDHLRVLLEFEIARRARVLDATAVSGWCGTSAVSAAVVTAASGGGGGCWLLLK